MLLPPEATPASLAHRAIARRDLAHSARCARPAAQLSSSAAESLRVPAVPSPLFRLRAPGISIVPIAPGQTCAVLDRRALIVEAVVRRRVTCAGRIAPLRVKERRQGKSRRYRTKNAESSSNHAASDLEFRPCRRGADRAERQDAVSGSCTAGLRTRSALGRMVYFSGVLSFSTSPSFVA